jgi:hypothetical protein
MFALPVLKANLPAARGGFRSRREHLDSKLSVLASGFTCIEARGVWKGMPEHVLWYIVGIAPGNVDSALRLLLEVAYDEEAIFVIIDGIGRLLVPPAREVKDVA